METVRIGSTVASKITSRRSDELREEERIVVYRKLIQDMLLQGVSLPDDRTRHVVAELINSIFDVEKMLYFVAPEWWRPRLHRSRQQLQETPGKPVEAVISTAAIGDLSGAVLERGLIRRIEHAASNVNPSVINGTARWAGAAWTMPSGTTTTSPKTPSRRSSAARWDGCCSSTATTCAMPS